MQRELSVDTSPKDQIQAAGDGVLQSTRSAMEALAAGWDPAEVGAWADMVIARPGRLVLCGMGKSGLIAQKISATLASTGSPSFFLHPAEALHGDLGMVTEEDSALLLSNSGESEEVVRLLPSLARLGIPMAAITGRRESTLARSVGHQFIYDLPGGEGCPLDLAPMASTTLQLVWGDILAASLMARRNFTRDHFAKYHPAGSLGARLLKVKDLMHYEFPVVHPETSLLEVLKAMSGGRLGMAAVLQDGQLAGVVSDGDVRRAIEGAEARTQNPLDYRACDFMGRHPRTIGPEILAVEAAARFEAQKITFLLVTEQSKPLGVLHIHDLLAAKVI
jgi:arabinose-5-phosphate isomerase